MAVAEILDEAALVQDVEQFTGLIVDRVQEGPVHQGEVVGVRGVLELDFPVSGEAEAVLAGPSLRMSDLLALEAGQVLVLGEAAGSQLECRINGKTVFRGDWIHQGNQGALQIQ